MRTTLPSHALVPAGDDMLPMHPTLRHPISGQPLRAVGFTRSGKPMWPVMGGSQPIGEPPANPDPAPPAAPPAGPPVAPPVPTPAGQPATGNGPNGYPENTPLASMSDAQQAAYWRHHSRQHEERWKAMGDYDDLKARSAKLTELETANMTDQQKAVAEAELRGRQAALKEAGAKLVDQFFRAVLHERKTPDEIAALTAPLDRAQFLTADGLGVDTDKVTAFANAVAPPPASTQPAPSAQPPAGQQGQPPTQPATGTLPRKIPDMGQGPSDTPKPSGLEAGRLIAQARFGKTKQPAQ